MLTYGAQTSALAYAPSSRPGHHSGLPLQTLSQLQPDELSPQGDSRVQKRTLLLKLMAYLSMIPASPTKAGPLTPYDLMRMPWRISSKRLSLPEDPNDPLGTGDGKSALPPSGIFVVDSICLSSTCPGLVLHCVRAGQMPGTWETGTFKVHTSLCIQKREGVMSMPGEFSSWYWRERWAAPG